MGSPSLAWSRDDFELAAGAGSSYLSLPFSPLTTSHGGTYTCAARLIIPLAGVDLSHNMTYNLAVIREYFCLNIQMLCVMIAITSE